jgi:hypothetical protein
MPLPSARSLAPVPWPTHQQPYEDRRHAGVELAARLRDLKRRPDVVVLALPRGVFPSRTKSLEPSTHRSISSRKLPWNTAPELGKQSEHLIVQLFMKPPPSNWPAALPTVR